jgi:ribosomal protein L35
MPKQKTHKASKGRIRVTSTGKLLRTQCGVRHLLAERSPKRMRNLTKKTTTEAAGYKRRARYAFRIGQPSSKLGPKYEAKNP